MGGDSGNGLPPATHMGAMSSQAARCQRAVAAVMHRLLVPLLTLWVGSRDLC